MKNYILKNLVISAVSVALLVACGKKDAPVAKKDASAQTDAPSGKDEVKKSAEEVAREAAMAELEGTWLTRCIDGRQDTFILKGGKYAETRRTYDNTSCTGGSTYLELVGTYKVGASIEADVIADISDYFKDQKKVTAYELDLVIEGEDRGSEYGSFTIHEGDLYFGQNSKSELTRPKKILAIAKLVKQL